MTEFKDANIILHELEQLFNRDDDIKDILDIRKMQSEIETQCAAHLKDTKEIIRGEQTVNAVSYLTCLSYWYCTVFPFFSSGRASR